MSIRGNGGTPRGHGDAKNAPKEKKALRQKWEAAPIAYPYDEIPEAQQFLTCCPATADRMIDAVETYNRRSNDGEVCRVASCFPKVIFFTPPRVIYQPSDEEEEAILRTPPAARQRLLQKQLIFFTPPRSPCKYELADEQHFASMMLYHHCKRQYPSVVFRQKLAPGQLDEVIVIIVLQVQDEGDVVQYEGTWLSGATAFKFTSPVPVLGQEIYFKARLAMAEHLKLLGGEPFSLTAPQQETTIKIVHLGDGLNLQRLIEPSDEEEERLIQPSDQEEAAMMRTPPAAKRRLLQKQRTDDEGWIAVAGVKRARGNK